MKPGLPGHLHHIMKPRLPGHLHHIMKPGLPGHLHHIMKPGLPDPLHHITPDFLVPFITLTQTSWSPSSHYPRLPDPLHHINPDFLIPFITLPQTSWSPYHIRKPVLQVDIRISWILTTSMSSNTGHLIGSLVRWDNNSFPNPIYTKNLRLLSVSFFFSSYSSIFLQKKRSTTNVTVS